MSQVGWMPRFSLDGTRRTWQRENYWRAQFLDATREIGDNGVNLMVGGKPIAAPSCNELGAGGGVWAAFRTDPPRVFTSAGATILGAGCPAVNPDGKIAYVDDQQAGVKNLIFNGQPVARGGITDVRCSRTALVWLDNGQAWGLRLDQLEAVARKIQVAPWEAGPVPIDTPIGPWVGCYTQTGLILRPFGESNGYRFDNNGQTYYPDWVYRDGGVLAIFTNEDGVQDTQPFDLTAPRVSLSGPVNPASVTFAFNHPVLIAPFKDLHGESGAPAEIVVNQNVQAVARPYFAAEDSVQGPFMGERLGIYTEVVDPALLVRGSARDTRLLIGHDSDTPWSLPPGLRSWDIPAVELYWYKGKGETLTQAVARWQGDVPAMLAEWPGDCAVIPQFYCMGGAKDGTPPEDLTVAEVLQTLAYLSDLVNLSPRIKIVAPFAWQRANGIVAHPELQQAFESLLRATPGIPILIPVGTVPAPPSDPLPVPVPPTPPQHDPEPVPVPVPPTPAPVPSSYRHHKEHHMADTLGVVRGPGGKLGRPDAPNTGPWAVVAGWRGLVFDGTDKADERYHYIRPAATPTALVHVQNHAVIGCDATEHSGGLDKQFYQKPDGDVGQGWAETFQFYDGNSNGAIEAQVEYAPGSGGDDGAFFSYPLAFEVIA